MPDSIPTSRPRAALSAGRAILIGHLVITLPVLAIFVGAMRLGQAILGDGWFLLVLVGFGVSWLWWSVVAPRWRQWALDRGAPPDELQRLAAANRLLWRKGSAFEKTEIKPRKK
jgi:hypothetical protein